MIQFLKIILLGILYIVISPLLVAILALAMVYGLFVFVFLLFKSVFLFFTGCTIFSDYPEDVAAKKILGQIKEGNAPASTGTPQ